MDNPETLGTMDTRRAKQKPQHRKLQGPHQMADVVY
jgi:hypothetical protein